MLREDRSAHHHRDSRTEQQRSPRSDPPAVLHVEPLYDARQTTTWALGFDTSAPRCPRCRVLAGACTWAPKQGSRRADGRRSEPEGTQRRSPPDIRLRRSHRAVQGTDQRACEADARTSRPNGRAVATVEKRCERRFLVGAASPRSHDFANASRPADRTHALPYNRGGKTLHGHGSGSFRR